MSMNDLFYTNMYSVMYQWNDFSVSKHLYKAYFNAQKNTAKSSSSDEDTSKKVDTSKLKNYTDDKLGTLTKDVTSAYSALKTKLEAGDGTTTFDYDAAYNAASNFVNKYNDMMSAIGKSGNATVSGKASYIDTMANSFKNELASVGITIDKGQLQLDEAAFREASQDQLKSVFTAKGSFGAFVDSSASSLNKFASSEAYTKPSSASTTSSSTPAKTYNSSGTVSELLDKTSGSNTLLDYLV